MTKYELATDKDDSELRTLLRDNVMPAWVSMSTAREPSYFSGVNRYGRDWAFISRQDDVPIGMYTCSEHQVHLNGTPTKLGYLGALRINPSHRNRLRLLKEGFSSIRMFSEFRAPDLWYTSIASENQVARRILEANLRGMPQYRATNDMITLALPRARGCKRSLWRHVLSDELEKLCNFYNNQAKHYQFSPALTPEVIACTGASFYVIERHNEIRACMALWNQQSYKQVIACGYRHPLKLLLPALNAYARLTKKVVLPRVGQKLDQTFLAFLAVSPHLTQEITMLIEDALAINQAAVLTLGLHAGHPWLAPLRQTFQPVTFRTRVYTVYFDETIVLDGRPAQPEVAVL